MSAVPQKRTNESDLDYARRLLALQEELCEAMPNVVAQAAKSAYQKGLRYEAIAAELGITPRHLRRLRGEARQQQQK